MNSISTIQTKQIAPTRPASRNCLNQRRQNKYQKPKKDLDPTALRCPRIWQACRFDDMACAVQHAAHLAAFFSANTNPAQSGWEWPTLIGLFAHMQHALQNYPTFGGGTFGDYADAMDHSLVLALCDAPTFSSETDLDEVSRVDFQITHGNYPVDVLMSLYRWRTARRKFSLPNGRWVEGPYLALLAVDRSNGNVSRGRLWPIWLSPNSTHYAFTRSSLERTAVETAYQNRMVFFTPTHLGQLKALQDKFGTKWSGNIANCIFLPDFLALPSQPQFQIGIGEIYGLPNFQRYVPGMRKKLEYYPRAAVQDGFISIPIRPFGNSREKVCAMVKAEIVSNLTRYYSGVVLSAAKSSTFSEGSPVSETQICA
jgi:hypothetical protein